MRTLLFLTFLYLSGSVFAQLTIDTLAIQDFELTPATPTWTYTGTPNDFQSGYAPASTDIPNTPLGITGSRAWHVASVSGGNPVAFANTAIPQGYDSVSVNFRLAALNLLGTGGGPDELDYVLVEYSFDNGATWTSRLRIRGAANNNAVWAYDASGVASVLHLPASETTFAPVNSGIQDAEGYSFCEIRFPGSITQLAIRITPRSSSSTDSWLIDNVLLTGETLCTATTGALTATACESYMAPSGMLYNASGTYTDTIPNAAGCDSIITIDLTINPNPDLQATQNGDMLSAAQAGAQYQWLDCADNYAAVNGADQQDFSPSTGGTYAVAIDLVGCVDTSSCLTIAFSGIGEMDQSFLRLYPNPATDALTVQGLDELQGTPYAELWTADGRRVEQEIEWKKAIKIAHLPNGLYYLKIAHDQGSELLRFVKQ